MIAHIDVTALLEYFNLKFNELKSGPGLYPSHFYNTETISLFVFRNQVPKYVLLSTDAQKTAVHIEKNANQHDKII